MTCYLLCLQEDILFSCFPQIGSQNGLKTGSKIKGIKMEDQGGLAIPVGVFTYLFNFTQ